MSAQDQTAHFQSLIQEAYCSKTPLNIRGHGSKQFYTQLNSDYPSLNTLSHHGVIDYDPCELVLTVRSGTTLETIHQLLASEGQMLAFEPPSYSQNATIGGTLACGLSGPRRPFAGSARDFTLGCKLINGTGETLRFGGRVMKNVAGFDVSRLMAGAMGTLGLMLEISLKVLPKPEAEITIIQSIPFPEALHRMTELSRHPLPISGSSYVDGNLYIRLSGHSKALIKAHHSIGGDLIQQADIFWKDLNEQRLDFFQKPSSLLRISLPAASPALPLRGEWLYDWGGSLRWLKTDEPTQALTLAEKNNETFVSSFDSQIPISQSLPSELGKIHQQLRAAFDPEKILNRGCRLDQLIYRR